ncbi:MAG: hypothetical protein H6551_03965 [Chitinophagales bacterium]|nr:hypothetical protein [Chitinophagaceae bacterium]MCB9064280.1 hypothetical protein [Chitinophagales bacterium]
MQTLTIAQTKQINIDYKKAIVKKDIAQKITLFVSILACLALAVNI